MAKNKTNKATAEVKEEVVKEEVETVEEVVGFSVIEETPVKPELDPVW